MAELKKSKDSERKNELSSILSDLLIQPCGLTSLYNYFSSQIDDTDIMNDAFCKVLFAQPSKYASYIVSTILSLSFFVFVFSRIYTRSVVI